MSPQQLAETTMNRDSRTLIQVTIEDAELAECIISTCMGSDTKVRRDYIIDNYLNADIDA